MAERRFREDRAPYGEDDGEIDQQPVRDEDRSTVGGFVMLPSPVLWTHRISPRAKVIYGIILGHARQTGMAFAGQDGIARKLGMQQSAVARAIAELREAGLVRVDRRGQGKTNLYSLAPIREWLANLPDTEQEFLLSPYGISSYAPSAYQEMRPAHVEVDQGEGDQEEVDPSYRSFVPPPPVGDEPARVSRGGAAAQGTGAFAPSVPIRSSGGPRSAAVRDLAGHEVSPPSQRRGAERDTSSDRQADQCWSAWKSALGREPTPAERAGIGRWLGALRRGGVVFTARQWHFIFHEAAHTPGARSVVALARTIAIDCPTDRDLADFTQPPPRAEGWAVPEVTVPESAITAMRRRSPGVYE